MTRNGDCAAYGDLSAGWKIAIESDKHKGCILVALDRAEMAFAIRIIDEQYIAGTHLDPFSARSLNG